MPRPHRIKGDDIHYHVVLRCNNKERFLQTKADFESVLKMLSETKRVFDFRFYNYVLMNTHIHLLLSTHNGVFIDRIVHDFCFKFAKEYNQKYNRSGHFWAHRYRSRVILNDRHGLACLRYQHRNPLTVGLASKPEDWPWHGYSFYAYGSYNPLLEAHPSYLGLANDDEIRRKYYRNLIHTSLPADKYTGLFEGRGGLSSRRFSMLLNQLDRMICHYQQEPGSNW